MKVCFNVKEINFIGNNHTKQHILKRELTHLIPGKFDSLIASQDRDKIYNLGLFSNVEIYNQDSKMTAEAHLSNPDIFHLFDKYKIKIHSDSERIFILYFSAVWITLDMTLFSLPLK